jgi:hypothetical protein
LSVRQPFAEVVLIGVLVDETPPCEFGDNVHVQEGSIQKTDDPLLEKRGSGAGGNDISPSVPVQSLIRVLIAFASIAGAY